MAGPSWRLKTARAVQHRPRLGPAFRPLRDDASSQVGVHDLAEACTPASVRPAQVSVTSWPAIAPRAAANKPADGALATAGRQTVEGRPVIGDKEHYATKRPRRGRFALGLEEPHTSSTRAIGALSP